MTDVSTSDYRTNLDEAFPPETEQGEDGDDVGHLARGAAGRVLVMTSGKGGVGKTTSSAAIGTALAKAGRKVIVIDFDIGLRNLDLVMGTERRVVFDIIHVIRGEASVRQATIADKRVPGLSMMPASQTEDKEALTAEGVARIIGELRDEYDWIICDSPAGIDRASTMTMEHADEAVVVVNLDLSSVRDADRIIALLDAAEERRRDGTGINKHILVTRYDPERAAAGDVLDLRAVEEMLCLPLIGVIPADNEVVKGGNSGSPVTLAASGPAGDAYRTTARRLLGEDVEIRVPEARRRGWRRLLGR